MKYIGLLPIGSVVTLKNSEEQDVMIAGYCVRKADETEKLFDYCGCLHPVGMLGPQNTLLFNHGQIRKIKAVGYVSDASYVVIPRMEEILGELRKEKEGQK